LIVTRRPALLLLVAVVLIPIVVLAIPLILGIADCVATKGTKTTPDKGAFEAAATLITNDASDGSATESAYD
jgi:hypothetical protein